MYIIYIPIDETHWGPFQTIEEALLWAKCNDKTDLDEIFYEIIYLEHPYYNEVN